ncbi:hypothetical protein MMSR116_05950 [Methylobacterium mesophilicum SR1.6/6]|uniref:Uncharacterized protein n=1 Tax=Methylobacterium mesophilicum SR1.6/6 TaxID=908290 RepID=A0A6B9FI96_9HYPH|nr:hypothetical protein [Methylobacterium mesophilicum]QGY01496.1 hypothetical protein MMSR116_05950 [Methylobacterium mesophilicum SR1.6/6]
MIRALKWLWHRARGNRWAARARHHMRLSRLEFDLNRACAERARRHFARADELYPPPPRGPPDPQDPADGDTAAAQRDGPQIR